ncbi:Kinase family protein with ARM repeat domain isoform 2 [Hibiscus syriacus]|uniref:Kinase family protein with ARM repeat domain isoform 2 n=1 Tax=Hibiscus syriacus TaxID=106335 RepID=A0A6A2Y8W2_HIBSY|nr:Kinase family protein with ARM repeat domain isoform 2 [Hibiscus syriacus]
MYLEISLLEVKHGLLQIVESLDFLHNNAHLIHRAISPENVLITSSGAWKLGFRFAISTDQTSSDSATVKAFHYSEYDTEDYVMPLQPSLNYTAPELVRNKESSVGWSSDIFNNSGALSVTCTAHAYDDSDPRIQEDALRKSLLLAKQLDTQLVKDATLPRVHGLALKTTVAADRHSDAGGSDTDDAELSDCTLMALRYHELADQRKGDNHYSVRRHILPKLVRVRVNALLCLADFVHTLNKHAVLDVLQTIQRCTAVDRSAPTLMCTLAISNAILKHYGVEFTAENVLPLLTPLLTTQQLNIQQFVICLEQKSGTVASAKPSTAWYEDWGPTARGTTSVGAGAGASATAQQPSKDNSSTDSILSDKSIQSASKQSEPSVISTVSSQQVLVSCPAVDIEWPPRATSGITAESDNGEKQLNTGTSSASSFDDLDPNWPPRTSASNGLGSLNDGTMGGPATTNYGSSSFTSMQINMNNPNDKSNSWAFSNQNSGELLRPNL